ncbi:DNRLRE domain-containing protein [Streptosporangium sp. NBC_01810]|uniref:DNRLRE domain-containing protein n=1 Tax=Streptosporangium sp. NBC_01810 TaxID=2975951 RepID=UPI002DDA21E4|nr:DNRLRE domain-containing protein [Streptosporangium sp. NBC_01810]WSA24924.1 DNRLRE domain-containing protein [Streptosporangium sp. NBC_01810]
MAAPAIADPTPTAPAAKATTAPTPVETAKQEAKEQNKPIEIESLHTENSTTVANPDGKTVGTYVYSQPVRIKQDGAWRGIDTTLVAENGVVKPRVAKLDISLSNGGTTTLLTAKGESLGAKKGKAGEVEISAPSKLPAPKLSGNKAVYESVYGRGIDLVVTVTPTGFHQEIVIRERPTKQLKLPISVDLPAGMDYGKTSTGKAAVLAGDQPVTDLAMVRMLDATAAEAPGSGRLGAATTSVEEKPDGPTVVLSPDAGFLADPQVTYPVTLAAAGSDWYGAGYPDDTFINNKTWNTGGPNQSMYKLLVGNGGNAISNGPTNDPSTIWRSYLRFDLTGAPFMGQEILNADLRPWNYRSHACGDEKGDIVVRRITSTWSVNSLSWSNQPTVTTSGQGVKGSAVGDHCSGNLTSRDVYYTIEDIVRDWSNGQPNYGLRVGALQEGGVINWREFRSANYTDFDGHPPHLFVQYEMPAEPLQVLYMRPRSDNSTPTLNEVLAHVDDSVIDEPADPDPVTPAQLKSENAQSTEVVGSKLKDAALPDGLTPEEIEQWSNPDIGEDPTQPVPPKPAIAHWLFDEATGTTAADSTINDNPVTLNDTSTWVTGKSGHALSNMPASQVRVLASQEAAKQSKSIEVKTETSETSITYAQPDGKTFKTEIAAGPVRTKRNGTWVPIDTSLLEQGGVLKPKAIKSGTALEISTGGADTFVKMTAADGQSYALRWPTALPKPTFNKNVATFTDAAGRGADLVVTVLPTGFRHDVVLRERPAKPLELRIGVETGSLTLTEGKGGRLLLTDTKAGTNGKDKSKDNKLVASAPQPVMWDASAGARLAKGRLPQARHAKIATDVVTTGGRTELVLKPDHAFLSDPATRYPVRVDPTTTLPFNHDVEIASTSDADLPADPTAGYLMAGRLFGDLSRVHLRFDTAALTGSTVTDARLSLLNIDAQGCGPTVGPGIQVRRLTSAWDENNLYWANKPTSTTEDAQINRVALGPTCEPAPLEWPVTAIAQDWAGGAANHGLVLQHPNEANTNDNYRVFPSAEETFEFNSPPTLTVTTTGPASAPTIGDLTITPAQAAGGVTTVTSLTPQLAATVSDTIGGTLTGEFEIEHDPAATGQGTGQIWTGASTAVASGTQATAAIPAGELTDGWLVRWRARAVNAAAATASGWSAWQQATVDLLDLPSGPAVSALQVVPSALVGGKTTTSSLTPSLRAQVDDPAGGTLRADFEVEHDPAAPQGQGSGQIWAGSADNVAAGTQAAANIPAGELTDGWLVRWRARAASATATSPWSEWQLLTVDPTNVGEEPLAAAATPLIRTDESFAIAAWVRLDDGDGRYAIAEQKGANAAPFHLGVDPAHGLVFTMKQTDSAASSEEGALSETAPPVGEWFHLAGTYDYASKKLSLYLNGNLIKTQTISFAPWNANGPFTIGTSIKGGIDDLWVFPRGLSAAEVSDLYAHPGATTSPADTTSAPHESATPRASEEAKGVTQLAANPLPWPVGKAHPIRYENYAECDADVAQVAGFTSFRSRFSGCYSGQVTAVDGEKVNNLLVVKGTFKGDITLLIDADQRSRAVVIRAKFDNIVSTGTLAGTTVGLKLKPKGYPTNAHCQPDLDSPFGPNIREKSKASWNANPLENFAMTSTAAGAEGADKISTCNFSLLVKVTPIGNKTRYVNVWTKAGTSDKDFKARCDSASYVYTPSGGCVFTYRSAFMEMARNDVNDRGEEWPEQYDHIKKALTNPSTEPTYPIHGGNLYPHSFGRTKNIPGGSPQNPLKRLKNLAFGEVQREKSEYVCRKEIQATWSSNIEGDPLAENCDEYPFASVEEGALGANPDFNFSVLLIRATHNQAFGRALGAWYGNNRILKEDPFWIKLP